MLGILSTILGEQPVPDPHEAIEENLLFVHTQLRPANRIESVPVHNRRSSFMNPLFVDF